MNICTVKDDKQITPSLWKDKVGGRVTFTCNSFGYTRWFVKVSNIVGPAPLLDSIFYTINSIAWEDDGYYYCYGHYKRRRRHFLARAKLIVYSEL